MPEGPPASSLESEIAHLYDAVPVALCFLDRELRFVRVNARFARINGCTAADHAGRTFREMMPTVADAIEPILVRVIETGEAVLDRLVSGETNKWSGTALVSYYPFRDPAGAVAGVTTVVRDVTHQQVAEDALQASEAKYRALIETTDTGFVIVDAGGTLLDANDKHVRLIGRTHRSEVVGRNATEWVAPYEHERFRAALTSCLHGGSIKNLEVDFLGPDGEVRPVEINGSGFTGPDGTVVMGLIRDIRERKESEQALRESEEKYRTLVETADDAIVVTDLAGRVRFFNSAYLTSLGYERKDEPPDAFDRVHPDDRADAQAQLSDLPRGARGTAEYRVQHRDGHWIHRSAKSALIRDHAGDPQAVLTVIRDITDRVAAEAALRESEDRYRTLVEHAPEALVVLDTETGRFVDCNDNATALYGMSRDQLLRTGPVQLSPPRQPDGHRSDEAALAYIRRAVDGEVPAFEWTHLNARGEEIPCEIRLVALPASARKLVRGSVTDISERKRAETALRRSQKLESLGVLAGGIAHDFNNLLVGILGNAELARMDLPPDSPLARPLDGIERAAQSASDLIRQMLAYSGKTRFEVRPVDLNRLIEDIAGLLRTVGPKARTRYEFAEGLPRVDADRSQLQQVVMNLITNAAESLDAEGGDITIRTGSQQHGGQVERSYFGQVLDEGTYVFLEVVDTGCGMDPDTQSKMFEPFFTTKFTGRGLGLAALLGIVRGHHGDIRVRSDVGDGTSVTILLPASSMPGTPATVEQAELELETEWVGRGTVLVVDDEDLVRDVACRTLESVGFDTVEAADGRDGVETLRAHQQDITAVVLDLTMPGPSAAETLKEMRNIRPDVRVLVSSGHAEVEVSKMLQDTGVAGFLQKPYRPGALLQAVREVLGQ